MHFNFQKIHFLKRQINENEFPVKIKTVHQATIISTLNHDTTSLVNPKSVINTIHTKKDVSVKSKRNPRRQRES